MRILMIGQNDPAGMMISFANALNRFTEHTVRVIALETRYSMEYEYDLLTTQLHDDDYGEVEYLLQHADLIHFHLLMDEDCTIGPLCIRDYLQGKPVVHHHHGHPDFLKNAERFVEKYQRLRRRVLVSTPDLLQLIPQATWQPNVIPINDAPFLPREDHLGCQEAVHMVQSPTRKWHKHTKEFRRAAAAVCKKHPFAKSHVLEQYSYRECLAFKRACHIVFDHMNGWFGISSLESLSHGIPTIAGIDEWNVTAIRGFTGIEQLPWVIVRNENQLCGELERLVCDPESRVEIGQASRQFMVERWNERRVLEPLLAVYRSL